MKRWMFVLAGGIVGLLVTPQSRAQCGSSITNTLQALEGSWTYSTDGFGPSTRPFATAGKFVARVGKDNSGFAKGLLSITQTSSSNGEITRLETDVGSYQV